MPRIISAPTQQPADPPVTEPEGNAAAAETREGNAAPVSSDRTPSDADTHASPAETVQGSAAPQVEKTPEEVEEEAWQGAYANNSRVGYKNYLKKYPNGLYAEEAKAKLAQKRQNSRLIIWALAGFIAIYVIAVIVMRILAAT